MIPKIIHQIWVGDKPAPKKWMDTWKEKNPGWEYILWDNKKIKELDIINKKQFQHYWDYKIWHGVADILRYQILYEYGGIMPGADSKCLRSIDDLFENNNGEVFSVSCCDDPKDWVRIDGIKDKIIPIFLSRGNAEFKDFITPIYASIKGNEFMKKLNEEIGQITIFGSPWRVTGNQFCQRMVKKYNEKIVVWPMHYFLPEHPVTATSEHHYKYIGKDKIYAEHYWGTTNRNYNKGI